MVRYAGDCGLAPAMIAEPSAHKAPPEEPCSAPQARRA
jgi:hypothetical protein